jgi:hypothetical protein
MIGLALRQIFYDLEKRGESIDDAGGDERQYQIGTCLSWEALLGGSWYF